MAQQAQNVHQTLEYLNNAAQPHIPSNILICTAIFATKVMCIQKNIIIDVEF